MSGMIDCSYLNGTYGALSGNLAVRRGAARTSRFQDMAVQASGSAADAREISGKPEAAKEGGTSNVDTYKKHLENKYGHVTIQSVGKDQSSLQKAGGRMNGSSVVIAPNMLESMANDPEKAAYYERKIDDFFNATPSLKAQFAAKGLTYEPCGVVIHEDGSVTYIGGCGDSPERVAEVNKINEEKARRKAEQRRQYQEMTAAAERTFSNIGDFLKARMISAHTITPEVFLPADANMFFLNLS